MKTTTYRFTALAAIALASALLLGACGSQKASTVQTSSSSSKTVQSSSSSSSKKAVKKTKASSSSSQEESSIASASSEKSPASSASTPAASSQTAQATTPKQGQATASNQAESSRTSESSTNDVSQLAGTWSNDSSTITINPDGTTSDNSIIERRSDSSYSLRYNQFGGAGVFYAPAGQEFPEAIAPKEYTAGTDISKERLVIGQSVDAMAHPYYRVN